MNNNDNFFENELDQMELEHQTDKIVLFHAILKSKQYNKPIPDWVERELKAAVDSYNKFDTESLDDSFNMPHRKGQLKNKATNRKLLTDDGAYIREIVLAKVYSGASIGHDLYKAILKEPEIKPYADKGQITANMINIWYNEDKNMKIYWKVHSEITKGHTLESAIEIVSNSISRSKDETIKWSNLGKKLIYKI